MCKLKLYALRHAKCPRCRVGNMFSNNTYGLHIQHMNDYCSHCNYRFEREPGYFYAAMFISYGMNVMEMLLICLLTFLVTGDSSSFWLYIGVLMGSIIILGPFNFRYSRVVLLYWLTPGVKFDPKA
ncbi:hypothetical protein LY11_04762 [Pedobacter cryoconitis]|uniref:DUF983 domain-containing protein n=1 Tax=Pedobacter cryoconitis TaxID=188932 RepID=A0A327S2W4_9SPHI|nr:hypothetical protein LY11_04762 [Pedobacter cryoconitis]